MKRIALLVLALAAVASAQIVNAYPRMRHTYMWSDTVRVDSAGHAWKWEMISDSEYVTRAELGASAGAYDDSANFHNSRQADSLMTLYAEGGRFWAWLYAFRDDTSSADGLPTLPTSGGGLVYSVKKSALAAGFRTGGLWSDTALGIHSLAIGVNNYAKDSATSLGIRAKALGAGSIVAGGWDNTASGAGAATLGGAGQTASGAAAAVLGGGSVIEPSTVSGNHSAIVGGKGLTVSGTMSVGFGHGADTIANDSTAAFINQHVCIDTNAGAHALTVAGMGYAHRLQADSFITIGRGSQPPYAKSVTPCLTILPASGDDDTCVLNSGSLIFLEAGREWFGLVGNEMRLWSDDFADTIVFSCGSTPPGEIRTTGVVIALDSVRSAVGDFADLRGELDLLTGPRVSAQARAADSVSMTWATDGVRITSRQITIDDTLIAGGSGGGTFIVGIEADDSLTIIGATCYFDSVVVSSDGEPPLNANVRMSVGYTQNTDSTLTSGEVGIISANDVDVFAEGSHSTYAQLGTALATMAAWPDFGGGDANYYLNYALDAGEANHGRLRVKARIIVFGRSNKFGGI